jgi:hypothetical protein
MNHVYVVIDSQHTIVGVFATHTQAQAAADKHQYFCRISAEPLIDNGQ